MRDKYAATLARSETPADTAESVAETIVEAAIASAPKLRYPSGKTARQVAFLRRFVPRATLDRKLHTMFGLS